MEKKNVERWICDIDPMMQSDDVDAVIKSLEEAKKEAIKDGFSHTRIKSYAEYFEDDSSYYYRYSLFGVRLETDDEFKRRKDEEEYRKKAMRDMEYKQYLHLKKKFGKEK